MQQGIDALCMDLGALSMITGLLKDATDSLAYTQISVVVFQ